MARFRRIAAVAGVAVIAGAMGGMPARADSPEVFSGSAAGTALDLAVLGKQATLGASSAKADSTGKAEAKGAGVLTSTNELVDSTLALNSTEKVATASGGSSDVKPKSCGTEVKTVAPLPEAVTLGLACSAASATSGAAPSATGEGSVADAGVDATAVVKAVTDMIETVEEKTGTDVPADITEIGGTVAGLLQPVCDAVQDNAGKDVACAAQTTVEDLIDSVLTTKTLEIGAGSTTSSVKTTDAAVISSATASGAVVKILPLPQVDGLPSSKPVVTITVGEANASATYDRGAGKASGDADPAVVRVSFNSVLTDALEAELGDDLDALLPDGVSLTNIVITPNTLLGLQDAIDDAIGDGVAGVVEPCEDGRAICILKGTPLESRIYLATSSVKTNPDGSVVATADAVRMDLATGVKFDEVINTVNATAGTDLRSPGVRLALAGVQAGVGGSPAQVTPTTQPPANPTPTPTPELSRTLPPAELPRTGGTPWIPLVGATVLSLAVLGRRVAAKATR